MSLCTSKWTFTGVQLNATRADSLTCHHSNVLTISGSTSSQKEDKADGYMVQERRFGSFTRSIAVPHGLKEQDIKASMADGVLKLEMPKQPAQAERKKITIG